jgi:hypothetical protein
MRTWILSMPSPPRSACRSPGSQGTQSSAGRSRRRQPPSLPSIARRIQIWGLVGNNLNQIARRLNQGSSPEADELRLAITKLAGALKTIRAELLGTRT